MVLGLGTIVLWLRPQTSGRPWITTIFLALLTITILPVHLWLARPLEDRFPIPSALPEKIDGIIVLGGIVDADTADDRGTLAISEGAERLMVPVALAFRHPEAKLMIAGRGEGHQTLKDWFTTVGLDLDRIDFEPVSRNTYENALLSHRKIQPSEEDTWLLVTSASHMPRAVGAFRKVGWSIIPYPVDFKTSAYKPFKNLPDLTGNLMHLNAATKEWIGLVAYYALDRSDALFPAPAE